MDRTQDQPRLEVISTAEELLRRARAVAERIAERVWAVMGGHPSSPGPHPRDHTPPDSQDGTAAVS